ncbi:hypothetical protein QE152_g23421 [Popillia japonica]|uniref:CUB domain-containing protein n=1 Tax=Popillia japonica TaxID=7064 RepID=A0AAW1KH95_POPJA
MTTTTELISTTTTNGENSVKRKEIICRDWARSPIALSSNYGDEIFTHTIYVKYEKFLFTFYDPDENPVKIMVTITGNLEGFCLLWFNTYNTTNYECISNMDNTMVLPELQRANSYTFCMLYNDEMTASPFDCFGFEIRVEFAERAWIRNKYSKPVTIAAIVALALAIFLSAFVMYCCVRRYPVLIKGNKRVVIVGRRKPAESTRPREYDKPAYIPPSFESMLSTNPQSNYGYTRVRRRHYRSPMLRSLSEHSIFSNEVAYIRPTGPTSYQLNTWRLGTRGGQPYVDTFEETVYGPKPPPLPPPNNINLEWEENLYTTL